MAAGRYALDIEWRNCSDNAGAGMPVLERDPSAIIYFFNQSNAETLSTVIDGSADNGAFWCMTTALIGVPITYPLTETQSGRTSIYQ